MKTNWSIHIVFLSILSLGYLMFSFVQAKSIEQVDTNHTQEKRETFIPQTRIGFDNKYLLYELQNWEKTTSTIRIGLQVGHLDNHDVPAELQGIKNNTGAAAAGYTEAQIVKIIAEKTAEEIKMQHPNIVVDILPAVVPPGYLADAFIAIHADGNTNSSANGFKIATPWRDYTGMAKILENAIYTTYGQTTNLRKDDNITRRMQGYYAFNWRRYEHAIHPMTPAVIVETGYLTSPIDRSIIVNNPDKSATGIANGIIAYLEQIKIL